MPVMLLRPFARLPCDEVTDCVALLGPDGRGDGTFAFTSARGTLVIADGDGVIVDELEMPEPGLTTTTLRAGRDGSVVGYAGVHQKPNGVLMARRGDGVVKRWQTDINQPKVQPVAGVGALVNGDNAIYLLRWDMTADAIPVPRVPLHSVSILRGPYWWNHDVLVMTAYEPLSMEEASTDHEYHCVGGDGVVRFTGAGRHAIPVDDQLALVWDDLEQAVHVIDRGGARLDTLEQRTSSGDNRRPLTRVGGDVILKLDMHERSPGLLRVTPRTLSRPVWQTPFPADNARFSQSWPIRVGRCIAIYLGGPPGRRGVFIVDADSGAPVTTLACDEEAVGGLVAVADDIVATRTVWGTQQQTDVWVGIDKPSPRRLTIPHEGTSHHAMCSPKPGVIACAFDDAVCLYRVT